LDEQCAVRPACAVARLAAQPRHVRLHDCHTAGSPAPADLCRADAGNGDRGTRSEHRQHGASQGHQRSGQTGASVVDRTAFMLTSTATAPPYGKLSDMHGRRLLFVVSITVLLIGSALCGMVQSMTMSRRAMPARFPPSWGAETPLRVLLRAVHRMRRGSFLAPPTATGRSSRGNGDPTS
jgi:hypothetical protein